MQIELETAAFRAGGDAMAYDTIVGSGTNSAVLHFAPTARVLRSGELVLIDAGAEFRCYASDITRTYPVDGRFGSEQQAELHGVVRAAELASIERCGPGTEWRDVHLTAALVIAEGLDIGGDPAWRYPSRSSRAAQCGCSSRTASGTWSGSASAMRAECFPSAATIRRRSRTFGSTCRSSRAWSSPSSRALYFVPAILQDPERRRRYRDEVDWDSSTACSASAGSASRTTS